jgi:hypothetical protein
MLSKKTSILKYKETTISGPPVVLYGSETRKT